MKYQNKLLLSMVAICVANSVAAQQQGRIEAGQFDIIPSLNTSMSYVDNVARATDGQAKIYSWRSILSPEIIAATEVDGNPVQFGYRLERGTFFSSSADDYTDHFVEALTDYELNSRHTINAILRYEDGHEDRGTGFSLGGGSDLTTPDTYKSIYYGAEYTYGSLNSAGEVVLKADRTTLDYDRNEFAYLIRDRATNRIGAEFNYQIAPSTELVFDFTRSFIRYDNNLLENSLESNENRLLVGIAWENTAATSGYAKIGYKEKDFAASNRDNFYGTDWEVGIEWQPLTYSTVNFSTSADTNETNGEGSLIRGRNYRLSWTHQWLERLSSSLRYARENNEYIVDDEDFSNRDDKLSIYAASLNYEARRWLSFSLFYRIEDRDSNREAINFDQSVVGVSAEVTL